MNYIWVTTISGGCYRMARPSPLLGAGAPMDVAIIVLYLAVLAILGIYGFHRAHLVYLFWRHRDHRIDPQEHFKELPHVTIQLPMFNELYVAERLLESVALLDYPKDKLELQVLDDSIDETTQIVEKKVAELKERGFDITHIHRTDRTGFKAGALEKGMMIAKGDSSWCSTRTSCRTPASSST